MKDRKTQELLSRIREVQERGDIIDYIDEAIYRLATHDDLDDNINFQNVMYGLHQIKYCFKDFRRIRV